MLKTELCFTKFNTVKGFGPEVTYDCFFREMKKQIRINSKEYWFEYDNKEDEYIFVYKNHMYKVMYGNEPLRLTSDNKYLISEMNELVRTCKNNESIRHEEEAKIDSNIKNIDNLMVRVNNEIYEQNNLTVEEKLKTLDILKRRYYEDCTDPIDNLAEFWEETNDGGEFDGGVRTVGGLVVAVLSAIFWAIGIPFFLYVLIVAGAVTFDGFLTSLLNEYFLYDYAGLIPLVFSIIATPFILIFSTGKRLIEKLDLLKEMRKIKNEIKNLKELLKKEKKQYTPKNKANIKEFSKIIGHADKLNESNNKSLSETLSTIKELFNNIQLIKDTKEKDSLSKELYSIISEYIQLSNNFYVRENVDVLCKKIKKLTEKVDIKLQKENEEEYSKTFYYKYITEVEDKEEEVKQEEEFGRQKSFGRR